MYDTQFWITLVWLLTSDVLLWNLRSDSRGWKRTQYHLKLMTWPIMLPCIAVKTLIQVARGTDLKLLLQGEELKKFE